MIIGTQFLSPGYCGLEDLPCLDPDLTHEAMRDLIRPVQRLNETAELPDSEF